MNVKNLSDMEPNGLGNKLILGTMRWGHQIYLQKFELGVTISRCRGPEMRNLSLFLSRLILKLFREF